MNKSLLIYILLSAKALSAGASTYEQTLQNDLVQRKTTQKFIKGVCSVCGIMTLLGMACILLLESQRLSHNKKVQDLLYM